MQNSDNYINSERLPAFKEERKRSKRGKSKKETSKNSKRRDNEEGRSERNKKKNLHNQMSEIMLTNEDVSYSLV